MREIKFRAWDGKNMYYTSSKNIEFTLARKGWSFDKDSILLCHDDYATLMQFTGLQDRNDQDIYEGDVISYTLFDQFDNDAQFKGVVKWIGSEFVITQIPDILSNGELGVNLDWMCNQDCENEIMGNIYENQNLIK